MSLDKVIVYSKAGCGQCVFTKRDLERAGVPYEERRIDLDEAVREEALALGAMGAPFVVTPGGDKFSGYQPAKLAQLTK